MKCLFLKLQGFILLIIGFCIIMGCSSNSLPIATNETQPQLIDALSKIKNGDGSYSDVYLVYDKWLKKGLNKETVLNALGPPTTVTNMDNKAQNYAWWTQKGHCLLIQFVDEIIVGYTIVSSYGAQY